MKIRHFIGGLLVSGAATLFAADVNNVVDKNRERNISDALVLEEPPMKFWDAYKYQWFQRVGSPREISYRVRDESMKILIGKLDDIERGDDKVEEIMVFLDENKDERLAERAIQALGRIDTPESYAAIESIVYRAKPGRERNAVYAVREIARENPARAVEIIKTLRLGPLRNSATQEIGILEDVMIEIGNNSALDYFLRRDRISRLMDFIEKNKGKPVLARRKYEILELLVKVSTRPYTDGDSFNCAHDTKFLYRSAESIYNVDREYAKNLIPLAEDSCPSWRGNQKQLLVGALSGK